MCIRRPESESDTIVFQLPKGYSVSAIPEKTELNNKFGKYSFQVVKNVGCLTLIRSFELHKGIYPASEYAGYRDFLEEINTNDSQMVALKKL